LDVNGSGTGTALTFSRQILRVNVKDWGATGAGGTSDDSVAIQNAYNSISSGILSFPAGTYFVGSGATLSFPAGVQVEFEEGASLSTSSHAITISGRVLAHPLQQIFAISGTGSVTLTATSIDEYPVKWWGLKGDGSTDDSANLAAALSSITTPGGTLVFPPSTGNYKIGSGATVTVPSNVQLSFKQGAVLQASGVTVTINGGIVASPTQQIFAYSGTSSTILSSAAADLAPLGWWGPAGDGVTDDSAVFNNAITSLTASGVGLALGIGTYKLAATVTFPSTVKLVFRQGAMLGSPVAQTINGPIDAHPTQQIFGIAHKNTVSGTGPTTRVTGFVNALVTLKVAITTGGTLGTGVFKYSLDNGVSYVLGVTIPLSGVYVIPGTGGFTLNFSASPAYTTSDSYTWTTIALATISLTSQATDTYPAPWWGTQGNAQQSPTAAMTSGAFSLTSPATFSAADIGKSIVVCGAGSGGANLATKINSVSGGVATLATAASTTVGGLSPVIGLGTSPPAVPTLSGTATGAFDFLVQVVTPGILSAMTFQYSTDGGTTWSSVYSGSSPPSPLTATNGGGSTGVSVTFAAGTYTGAGPGQNTYSWSSTWVVVWGNDDTTALANACAAVGIGTLGLSSGEYYIGSALTVPSTIELEFKKGAMLVAVFAAVNINGAVRAHPTQQILAGTGVLGTYSNTGGGPTLQIGLTYPAVPGQAFGFGPFAGGGAYPLKIEILTGGVLGTATFQYSVAGTTAYSAQITTQLPVGGEPWSWNVPGTGLVVTFPGGAASYVANAVYTFSGVTPPFMLSAAATHPFPAKWLGATGGGVTDDTAALQSAICCAQMVAGSKLEIPVGTYLVTPQANTSTPTWPNNSTALIISQTLQMEGQTSTGIGTGTVIQVNGTTQGYPGFGASLLIEPMFGGGQMSGTIVKNMAFIGTTGGETSDTATTNMPLDHVVVHTDYVTLENLVLMSCWRNGILLESGAVAAATGLLGPCLMPLTVLPATEAVGADTCVVRGVNATFCPSSYGELTETTASFPQPSLDASVTVNVTDTTPLLNVPYVVIGGGARATKINAMATLPAATITVLSTAGWPPSGSFAVDGQSVTYQGLTATTFTGCSGGTGTVNVGDAVTFENGGGGCVYKVTAWTATTLTLVNLGGTPMWAEGSVTVGSGVSVQSGACIHVHGSDSQGSVITSVAWNDSTFGAIESSLGGNTWVMCYGQSSYVGYIPPSGGKPRFLGCASEDATRILDADEAALFIGGALSGDASVTQAESVGDLQAGLTFPLFVEGGGSVSGRSRREPGAAVALGTAT